MSNESGPNRMPVELECGHVLTYYVNPVRSHPAGGAKAWRELLDRGQTGCPSCPRLFKNGKPRKGYPMRKFAAPESFAHLAEEG